jgi:hypothetical protein
MQRPGLAAALAVATCLFAAGSVRAQTCCTTTGANDLGVVDRDQRAVLGVELGHDRGYGSFDAEGKFRALAGAEVDDAILSVGAGIRLWPRALQVNAAVPFRFQYRSLAGARESHVGLGDAELGLRYLLLDAGRPGAPDGRFVPFVEPLLGLRLPTGTGSEEATARTLVDATGDGATLVYGGVSLAEYLSDDGALKLLATYGHRFARQVDSPEGTRRFAPGPEVTARAAFGHAIDLFWSWEVFLALRVTASSSLDGRAIADSATHRLRGGVAVAHYLRFPIWQLVASASFDPPVARLGSNVPFAGSSLILSVRRNFIE